uniref:Coiled-coil domain-containing protein 22 homolog n=1 Tax=Panagrellus redivivus TaxID=6233 RepID=A0A7E4W0F9_PANRE
MEHVDSMVLSTLAKLGCSFCDEAVPQTLEDLTRDDFIEGIVKLIWMIDPETKTTIPTFKLPGSAAQKFQVATAIANIVNELGLKRDSIGYHTLLYANVFEIRRIFITLIERLPKKKIWVEKSMTRLERLLNTVGERVQEDSTKQWVPEFCRYFNYKYDGKYWHRPEDPERVPFSSHRVGQDVDARFNLCRALEGHDDISELASVEDYALIFNDGIQKPSPPTRPALAPKPIIASKPTPPPRNVPVQKSSADSPDDDQEKLASEIALVKAEIQSQKHEILEFCYAHSRLEDDILYYNELLTTVDVKLLELLKEPEDSLEKLQTELAQIYENDVKTQEAFLKTKEELSKQLEQLRISKGLSTRNEAGKQHIRKVQDVIAERKKKLAEDSRQIAKLKKKISQESGSPDRRRFVSRIMEIMQTINALLEKRNKMFRESSILDREIVHLDGNLSRTYSVVDAWMMPASCRDGQLQQAYRDLISLHERCLAIRRLIEDCGVLAKDIDDVTNELELERQNAANVHLDDLLNDVAHIQDENAALRKQKETLLSAATTRN